MKEAKAEYEEEIKNLKKDRFKCKPNFNSLGGEIIKEMENEREQIKDMEKEKEQLNKRLQELEQHFGKDLRSAIVGRNGVEMIEKATNYDLKDESSSCSEEFLSPLPSKIKAEKKIMRK